MRSVLGLCAAALLVLAPVEKAAANGITKETISQSLEMQGYPVSDFQPNMIMVEVGEITVLVGVFGSDGDISYFTYLNQVSGVSHEFLSEFNSEVKFGRAYIDRDGDVTLQMDRNAAGGISLKNIESDFDVFLLLVSKFLSDIERKGSV